MIFIKRIRLAAVSLSIMLLSMISIASPVGVVAQFDPLGAACDEPGAAASTACKESEGGQGQAELGDNVSPVSQTVQSAANVIAVATGVIAVIIIIIAGIQMIFTQGDAGKIKTARDAIIYAVIGLVVIAVSRLIVQFVINRV